MSDKIVECYLCGSYQGVIRDGKLHKKLRFVCYECSEDYIEETPKQQAYGAGSKGLEDIMRMFSMKK